MRAWAVILLLFLMISGAEATGNASGTEIIVDANGKGDYRTIEDAIYNAFDGDTILVYPGTYAENLMVKKDLTIKSYSGNPEDTVIRAADPQKNVFHVTVDGVNISGFGITGAEGSSSTTASTVGIYLESVYYTKIFNNNIGSCKNGIVLAGSRNNVLAGNVVTSCTEYGIKLASSHFNTLSNNLMSGSQYNFADFTDERYAWGYNYVDKSNLLDGKPIYYLNGESGTVIDSGSNAGSIYCINCKNISIKNLQLANNLHGIYFFNTVDSRVENVNVSNTFHGIFLYESRGNNLEKNTFSGNRWSGIYLMGSSSNTIKDNAVNSNGFPGIGIESDSNSNKIVSNKVTGNGYGITISGSSGNKLDNNIVESNKWENVYTSGSSTGTSSESEEIKKNQEEEPKTIRVKPGSSIQEAIDSANPGDTIIVASGTYRENIDVDREVTIVSESGKPEKTIIYPDPGKGPFILKEGLLFMPAYGFYISANNVTVSGFTIEDEMKMSGMQSVPYGIVVDYAQNCTISDNIISHTISGMTLYDADNNIIEKNTLSNNLAGMLLNGYCDSNIISYNMVDSNNEYGIRLDECRNNILTDNTIKSNGYGLSLYSSTGNTLKGNELLKNRQNFGVYGYNGKYRNDIDASNLANGQKIYYLVGASDDTVDQNSEAGVVYCIGCRNISIKNLELKGNGVFLYNTVGSLIENNVITDSGKGICLEESHNNRIIGNSASYNSEGITLALSRNNTLEKNTADSNDLYGISCGGANNVLLDNIVSNNGNGISVQGNEIAIIGNIVNSNRRFGISLYGSGNELVANELVSNGETGVYLSGSANHLYLNNASKNVNGIFLVKAEDNIIIGNDLYSNDGYGAQIVTSSTNNTLVDNKIKFNGLYGVKIQESKGNILYNNFFENSENVQLIESPLNTWNATPSMSSNLQKETNVGGNFWADPDGTGHSQTFSDANQDSYCDLPYEIGKGNVDSLPLSGYNEIYDVAELQSTLYRNIQDDDSRKATESSEVPGKKAPAGSLLPGICLLGTFMLIKKSRKEN